MKHKEALEMEQMKQAQQMQEQEMAQENGENTEEPVNEEAMNEEEAKIIEVIQALLEMSPEEVVNAIEQYPALQEVIDILNEVEQPEQELGTTE